MVSIRYTSSERRFGAVWEGVARDRALWHAQAYSGTLYREIKHQIFAEGRGKFDRQQARELLNP